MMNGDLVDIGLAINLSVAVIKILNRFYFSLIIYNALGLPIAAEVLLPLLEVLLSPMIAALAMSVSSVSVIANLLRLRSLKLTTRTVAWVSLMENQCGLEPDIDQWLDTGELRSSLGELLTEIGWGYVPALLANARAVSAEEKNWQAQIDGSQWRQQTFPYQARCLSWINQQYRALTPEQQGQVDDVLAGTCCEVLLRAD